MLMSDSDYVFQQVDFDTVFNSHTFRELLRDNWEETGLGWEELDPDWAKYEAMAANGALRIYLASTTDGEPVGYSVYFLSNHLHYKDSIQAVSDMIFIHPMHRGFGKNFIAWIDTQLKNEGVKAVYRHATVKNRFDVLLRRLGYDELETTYVKRL